MTDKPEFRHHMIKEIFEQPGGLYDTVAPRVSLENGEVRLDECKLSADQLRGLHRINIIA